MTAVSVGESVTGALFCVDAHHLHSGQLITEYSDSREKNKRKRTEPELQPQETARSTTAATGTQTMLCVKSHTFSKNTVCINAKTY